MSSLAKLVIVAADGARRTYALHRYPVVIGRDEGCDITIVASQLVAARHVRIEQSLLTGLPILVDLASGGATLRAGNQVGRHEVADRDVFDIADVRLIFFLPLSPAAAGTPHMLELLSGEQAGTCLPLGPEPLSVGRRSSNTVKATLRDVSSFHARFRTVEGVPTVEDLGSRNGTFVNGFRLEPNRLQPLEAGDLVDLASMGVLVLPQEAAPLRRHAEFDTGDGDDETESESGASESAVEEQEASDERVRLLPANRPGRPSQPASTRSARLDEGVGNDTPYLLRRPHLDEPSPGAEHEEP